MSIFPANTNFAELSMLSKKDLFQGKFSDKTLLRIKITVYFIFIHFLWNTFFSTNIFL